MARPPDPVRRQELLDQVVRYLADHGLAGASLRPMAKALGVSLNGLVHHFGTKTDLLVAALARANELQHRESEGWLACNPALSQADLLRKWWRWINAAPEHLALVRLGLEAAALDATGGVASPARSAPSRSGCGAPTSSSAWSPRACPPAPPRWRPRSSRPCSPASSSTSSPPATAAASPTPSARASTDSRPSSPPPAPARPSTRRPRPRRPARRLRVRRASPRTPHPSFWSADGTLEVADR